MPRPEPRRLGSALVASALAHGLIAVLWLRPAASGTESSRNQPLDVEIVETRPPPAPSAAVQRTTPISKKRVGVVPRIAALPPPIAPADTQNDKPFRDGEGVPVRPPDLAHINLHRFFPPSGDETKPPAPWDPGHRIRELIAEGVGRNKVERGLAHTYFIDLGKKLIKVWDADRVVSRKGLKGFMEQATENSQLATRIWQQRAQVYGATGSPTGNAEIPLAVRVIPSPLACTKCGGRLSWIALITQPVAVRRILEHLKLPADLPRLAPARDPP